MITNLKEKEVFVFGSNLAGRHLGGAAKQAHEDFGAEWGVSEGVTGQSYAFPSLDENFGQRTIKELEESRDKLYKCASDNKDKKFLLTPVGTGIAGYKTEVIDELFKDLPENVIKLWE